MRVFQSTPAEDERQLAYELAYVTSLLAGCAGQHWMSLAPQTYIYNMYLQLVFKAITGKPIAVSQPYLQPLSTTDF